LGLLPRQPSPEALTNEELAAQLVTEAHAAAARRRALLTASVALASTLTVAAARKTLTKTDDLPPAVIADAIRILDTMISRQP
jgi:hypothetical protein